MSLLGNYFREIFEVVQSTRKGMALTWKHAWDARKQRTVHQIQDAGYFQQSEGIMTLEYPALQIPTPVNGRYQLHNEMDDCIVCDKCVKVCPVDCIDIEPIKATGLIGHASDGSPIRLYAAKFDIDMSKCCFCGLCTTVCPTECLTMTSEYDFSVFDVKEHNFAFANLTAEEADEKRRLYEQFVAEKAAMKVVASQQSLVDSPEGNSPESVVSSQSSVVSGQDAASPESDGPTSKPAFKPSFKKAASPEGNSPESDGQTSNDQSPPSKPKPAFKPSFKKAASPEGNSPESEGQSSNDQSPTSKPAFKPSFKKVASPESDGQTSKDPSPTTKPKPAFKPSFKKVASPEGNSPESVVSSQSSVVSGQDAANPEGNSPESEGQTSKDPSQTTKPKLAFKPSFKKVASPVGNSPESVVSSQSSVVSGQDAANPEGNSPESDGQTSNDQSPPSKPKPAFKPSFKKAASQESSVTSPESNEQGPMSNSPTSNPELP